MTKARAAEILEAYAFMPEMKTVEELVSNDIKDERERRLQAKTLLFEALQLACQELSK